MLAILKKDWSFWNTSTMPLEPVLIPQGSHEVEIVKIKTVDDVGDETENEWLVLKNTKIGIIADYIRSFCEGSHLGDWQVILTN